jgi:hypothetical protein
MGGDHGGVFQHDQVAAVPHHHELGSGQQCTMSSLYRAAV